MKSNIFLVNYKHFNLGASVVEKVAVGISASQSELVKRNKKMKTKKWDVSISLSKWMIRKFSKLLWKMEDTKFNSLLSSIRKGDQVKYIFLCFRTKISRSLKSPKKHVQFWVN